MKLIIDGAREIKNPTSRDIDEALKLFQASIWLDLENTQGTLVKVSRKPTPDVVFLELLNFKNRSFSSDMPIKTAYHYLKGSVSMSFSGRNVLRWLATIFGILFVFFSFNTFFHPTSQKVHPSFGEKLGALGSTILPLAGMAGYITWLMVVMTRVRPAIAQRLGPKLGVTIIEGRKGRWKIREPKGGLGFLVATLDFSILCALTLLPMALLLLGFVFIA